MSAKLLLKTLFIPLSKRNKTLYLATADPTNFDAFEDFEFNTGLQTEVVIVDFSHSKKQLMLYSKSEDLQLSEEEFQQFGDMQVQS